MSEVISGWIENKGYQPEGRLHSIRFRDGQECLSGSPDGWRWSLVGGTADITHYKVYLDEGSPTVTEGLKKTNILILGHKRHGKDTVAKILKDGWGFNFQSSSEAALDLVLWDDPYFRKYGSKKEAFEDRHSCRQIWKEKITEYNTPDKARLARKILENNEIYVGMRCSDEYNACREEGLFSHVIWVDDRYRKDDDETMGILYDPKTMIKVKNWGSVQDLIFEVYSAMCEIMGGNDGAK